jgi:uncharacterized protein YecE (DUF72 family)
LKNEWEGVCMAKGKIYIGTSGWSYEHWDENFYPKEIKSDQRLKYYCEHFDTVEINSTFYHAPSEQAVKHWMEQAPKQFTFSVKASQYITHRKRLNDAAESVDFFHSRMKLLEEKLGPILYQLPPSFKKNIERLQDFCNFLKKGQRYVFEFRHPSWFDEDIFQLLRKKHAAVCITDLKGHLSPEEVTADFTYIRLHGPKDAYSGLYGPKRLAVWKKKILEWTKAGIDVYCYFDNDEKAYAIQDARALRKSLKI